MSADDVRLRSTATDGVWLRSTRAWRDALRVWWWRRDPAVVETTESQKRTGLIRHLLWWRRFRNDPLTLLYVIEYGDARHMFDAGYVRLDFYLDPDLRRRGEVSIAVAEWARGHGVGPRALALAVQEVERSGAYPWARIRSENQASMIAFARAGFVSVTNDRTPKGWSYMRWNDGREVGGLR